MSVNEERASDTAQEEEITRIPITIDLSEEAVTFLDEICALTGLSRDNVCGVIFAMEMLKKRKNNNDDGSAETPVSGTDTDAESAD